MFYITKNLNINEDNKSISYSGDMIPLYNLTEKIIKLWKEYQCVEIPNCKIYFSKKTISYCEHMPSVDEMNNCINNILRHTKDKRAVYLKTALENKCLLTDGYSENLYIVCPTQTKKKKRISLDLPPRIIPVERISYDRFSE